jgi:hypothetical protein
MYAEAVKVLVGLCVLGPACFSLDPLNKPPNMTLSCDFTDGRPCAPDTQVHRDERILLHMQVTDPDGNLDPASFGWTVSACGRGQGRTCDPAYDAQHYDEDAGLGLEVEVPVTLPDDVRSISVDFEARDDRGGRTTQSLIFCLTVPPSTGMCDRIRR